MAERKVGRPRTNWGRLNLKLRPEVIENMRSIAKSEGFIIKQGDRMGEPSINAWLNNFFNPETN